MSLFVVWMLEGDCAVCVLLYLPLGPLGGDYSSGSCSAELALGRIHWAKLCNALIICCWDVGKHGQLFGKGGGGGSCWYSIAGVKSCTETRVWLKLVGWGSTTVGGKFRRAKLKKNTADGNSPPPPPLLCVRH